MRRCMRIPFGLPPLIQFHGVDGLLHGYNGVPIGLEALYQATLRSSGDGGTGQMPPR